MLKYNDMEKGSYLNEVEWIDNENGNFARVYFRIDTVGFECYSGSFKNVEDKQAFHDEATAIIKSFGVVESCRYGQNNEYLYAHPQEITGIVAKSKIKAIAEAINNSRTIKIRWTDVYEEYAIISDDDYARILNGKREEMAKCIVESCFTKRTNLFKRTYDIAMYIQEKFKLNRINAIEDINNPKMTFKYAMQVIQQLIDNGYLVYVEDNGNHLIRSYNKTEQKKKKISYDSIEMGGMML